MRITTLSIAVLLALVGSQAVAQTAASAQAATNFVSTSSNAVLPDGTAIRLRTSRAVSSADARPGDLVNLEVLDEIKVDDTVVISKGATGLAVVTAAEPRKLMGRGGKLEMNIDSVTLVNGQKVALRAISQSGGNSNPTSIVSALAASNTASAPLILVRGKDITISQGTELVAYVNGNVALELASLQPVSLEARNNAAAHANSATELHISTFPSSAEIQIDGKFIGMTPSDVIVRSGEHKIAVRLAGFKTWHETVTAAGEKLSFRIRLEQDGANGSTVSSCQGTDCSDLGDVARQKRAMQRGPANQQ